MAVYLITGNGGGKTSSSLGVVMRSLGHKHNVLVIEFLKWNDETGEYKFQCEYNKFFNNYFYIFQFGRKGWHGFDFVNEEDVKLCNDGLGLAKIMVKNSKKFKLLVLDEINLAVYLNLVSVDKVKEVIDLCRKLDVSVVMTGRHATKELIDISDVANEIVELKNPEPFVLEKGVQY